MFDSSLDECVCPMKLVFAQFALLSFEFGKDAASLWMGKN
jgi:hypothetical protein